MDAYTELKQWCEKNIGNHYKGEKPHHLWDETIINYTGDDDTYQKVIRIDNIMFVFTDDGNFDCLDDYI